MVVNKRRLRPLVGSGLCGESALNGDGEICFIVEEETRVVARDTQTAQLRGWVDLDSVVSIKVVDITSDKNLHMIAAVVKTLAKKKGKRETETATAAAVKETAAAAAAAAKETETAVAAAAGEVGKKRKQDCQIAYEILTKREKGSTTCLVLTGGSGINVCVFVKDSTRCSFVHLRHLSVDDGCVLQWIDWFVPRSLSEIRVCVGLSQASESYVQSLDILSKATDDDWTWHTSRLPGVIVCGSSTADYIALILSVPNEGNRLAVVDLGTSVTFELNVDPDGSTNSGDSDTTATRTHLSSIRDPICIATHPESQCIATGCTDGSVIWWYPFEMIKTEVEELSSKDDAHKQNNTHKQNIAHKTLRYLSDVLTSRSHWHSQPVSSISFAAGGSKLLSGGEEGVLCMWEGNPTGALGSQRPSFLPRLGAPVRCLQTAATNDLPSSSEVCTYVCLSLIDNSVKVADFGIPKLIQTFSYPSISSIYPYELSSRPHCSSEHFDNAWDVCCCQSDDNSVILVPKRDRKRKLDAVVTYDPSSIQSFKLTAADTILECNGRFTAHSHKPQVCSRIQRDTPLLQWRATSAALSKLDGLFVQAEYKDPLGAALNASSSTQGLVPSPKSVQSLLQSPRKRPRTENSNLVTAGTSTKRGGRRMRLSVCVFKSDDRIMDRLTIVDMPHQGIVSKVCMHPTKSGLFFTASEDGLWKLWKSVNVEMNKESVETFFTVIVSGGLSSKLGISDMKVSLDGSWMVMSHETPSSLSGPIVSLWDISNIDDSTGVIDVEPNLILTLPPPPPSPRAKKGPSSIRKNETLSLSCNVELLSCLCLAWTEWGFSVWDVLTEQTLVAKIPLFNFKVKNNEILKFAYFKTHTSILILMEEDANRSVNQLYEIDIRSGEKVSVGELKGEQPVCAIPSKDGIVKFLGSNGGVYVM